jgi:hypothetical protein
MHKKLLFVSFLILLLASCNSDENPAPEPLTFEPELLLRGWTYDTILWNGTLYAYDHNPDCYRDFFGFRNNEGQVYQFEETSYINSNCAISQIDLIWEPVGNHINFYFGKDNKVDTYEIISLTSELLTYALDRDIDEDGKKDHLVVTAIPYDPYSSYGSKTKKIKQLKIFPAKLKF